MNKYLKKKVAIVYDRVNKWGGAERVLLALHEMYPLAPLYTSVYDPKSAPWAKVFPDIKTSFLQNIPFAKSNHEFLPLFMPLAFESFDFTEYDLVISITSEAAKGIVTHGKTIHICYCLTPTRYLWSGYDDYFKGLASKVFTIPIILLLRKWDIKASKRPDVMIAISTEVQKRIKKYYRRVSKIVYPPVKNPEVSREVHPRGVLIYKEKYYLVVSRLDYGYKKVDLAIKTFNDLGFPLVIVGSGRLSYKLKRMAKANIKFVGRVSEAELNGYYQNAKALIMPQEEDFGIVSVEAQASGVPVIAYKKGGALDTVVSGKTGIFFKEQTVESLMRTVKKFAKMRFSERILKDNARRFTKSVFRRRIQETLVRAYNRRRRRNTSLAGIKK